MQVHCFLCCNRGVTENIHEYRVFTKLIDCRQQFQFSKTATFTDFKLWPTQPLDPN